MPLKHRTETLLITALTIVILLTGFLIASLPNLPTGIVPWSILFIASLAYPLLLLPLFRRDRADYEFRWLHWIPSILLLIWLLLAVLQLIWPVVGAIKAAYTWGWLLPSMAISLLLLFLFCTKVIRQWAKRSLAIILLFVPFMAIALWSASSPQYEKNIQAALWQSNWAVSLQTGISNLIAKIPQTSKDSNAQQQIAYGSSSSFKTEKSAEAGVNLAASSDPNEEKWRSFLRTYEGYSEISQQNSSVSIVGKNSSITTQTSSSAANGIIIGQNSSVPTHLPTSGMSLFVLIGTLLAAYCTTLHKRQITA